MAKWLGVIAAILLLAGSAWAKEPTRVAVELAPGLRGELFFDVDPAAGAWTPDEKAPEKEQRFMTEDGYRLRLAPVEEYGARRLKLELKRVGDGKFVVRSYGVCYSVPRAKVGGVWHARATAGDSLFLKPPRIEFQLRTAPNLGAPFVLCADDKGGLLAAAGWIDQTLLTDCSGRLAGGGADLQIQLTRKADSDTPLTRTVLTDGLFALEGKGDWFDAVRDYARTVDLARGYKPNLIPRAADLPAYSTWYAFGDSLSEKRIWENATRAKEAGMATIIIGAGWDTSTGGSWDDPGGPYGDFQPVKAKLPDLAALTGRIRKELDLKVELWAAPFRVGRASIAEERLKSAKLFTAKGEDFDLCPRHELTRVHLADIATRLMSAYQPDGLQLDLLDALPPACDSHHIHKGESSGGAFTACARALFETTTKANPDALIDAPHAGLGIKPFTNLWEAGGAPYDPEPGRLRGIAARPFSEGVRLRSHPAIWRATDSDAAVARNCAVAIMGGAPCFSLDLTRLPAPQLAILKAWVEFYRSNKTELLEGAFRPFGADFAAPDMKIEGSATAFIYLKSTRTKEIRLDGRDIRRVALINATDSEQVSVELLGLPVRQVTAKTYGPSLGLQSSEPLRATDHLTLEAKIPPGGMLVVE